MAEKKEYMTIEELSGEQERWSQKMNMMRQ